MVALPIVSRSLTVGSTCDRGGCSGAFATYACHSGPRFGERGAEGKINAITYAREMMYLFSAFVWECKWLWSKQPEPRRSEG